MPNVRPLNRKRDTRAGQNLTGQPGSHNCSDSTAEAAM